MSSDILHIGTNCICLSMRSG